MVLRKEIAFEKSIPYHVLTRAIDGRKIFAEEDNCYRCIFRMYAANIGKPAPHLHRQDVIKAAKALLNGEAAPEKFIIIEHSPLVYFLSFVVVPDHFHFELVSDVENGISKLMQKLKGGFAKFFNKRTERRGNLFERPYKIIPIQTNFQADAILRYINVINVLDVYQPGWRKEGLRGKKTAFKFLNEYPFSSFSDLFGKRKSKIIAPREILEKYLGKEMTISQEEFINFIKDFLHQRSLYNSSLFLE